MSALEISALITCFALPAALLFAFLRTEAIRRGNTGALRRIFTAGLVLSLVGLCGGALFMLGGIAFPKGLNSRILLDILIFAGAGFVLPILFLLGVFRLAKKAGRYRASVVIGATIIAIALIAGINSKLWAAADPPSAEEQAAAGRRAVQTALKAACGGTGIEGAADYDPDAPGPHPVVILDEKGRPHEWSDLIPAEWYPASVAGAELVVCVGDEDETKVDECQYVDEFWGTRERVPRLQLARSFSVVVAQTGETLSDETLSGAMPPSCPARMEGQAGTFKVRGEGPAYSDLEVWLKPFVLPTEE